MMILLRVAETLAAAGTAIYALHHNWRREFCASSARLDPRLDLLGSRRGRRLSESVQVEPTAMTAAPRDRAMTIHEGET
jgi:hypothetical protein